MASRLERTPRIQVFATDIDDDAVRKAREGIFPPTIEADVSQERLYRYFSDYHGQYRIKKEVRELVLFAPHDLLRDSPFSRLDLVSCRNLLIYLKPEAQHRALDIFHFGLRPGGLLVLGSAEGVNGDHSLFAPLDKRHRIYLRRNTARLPMVQLTPRPRQLLRDVLPLVVPHAPVRGEPGEGKEPDFPSPQRLSLSEMHARLIEEHGPPSVIVDENYDIIHLSARAGAYLRFTGGEPSANLLKLVDETLRLELRTALFRAAQTRQPIFVFGILTRRDAETRMTDLRVWPLHTDESEAALFLVMLEERPATNQEKVAPTTPQPHEPVARHLEEELRQTRDRLNSTVEHYENSHEELKAANEELQAMNEEMRSATEELETSKEELQSVNEELTTLNQELKSNIEALNWANSDLQNLIESTDIATVFLTADLRIKRYTPHARDLFNLLPADLGRPLSDITTRLEYPALSDDAAGVLRTLEKIEREVNGVNGTTYLARLSPYRTIDDRISGVVVAFINVTASKQAEIALRKSEEEFRRGIEEAPIPMIMQAEDGQVLQVSRTWTELTGYTQEEIPTFEAWLNKAYGFGGEDVRDRMRRSFHGEAPLEQVEFDIITRKGERRTWSFSASPIGVLRDGRRFIVGMATDVTERRRAEEASRASEQRLQRMVNMPRVGVLTLDYGGVMLSANDAFLEMIGYDREEFEKKRPSWRDFTPPEYMDPSLEVMTAVRETGRGGPYEKEYIRKDGTRIWLMFVASDIGDGTIVEYAVDINDRKRVEEAWRKSEERFRLLVEGAKDYAMFLLDLDNRITFWSNGAERVFGWSEAEAVGQTGALIFTPEDIQKGAVENEISIAMNEGRAPDRRWHLRKDGRRIWLDGVMTRLDDADGSPRGLAKIARDASDQHEAEEALRHARDEMEQNVIDRTRDVIATNVKLERTMSERQQLERELLEISEREKRRIGEDLHDMVCQELTATALVLKSSAKKLGKENPAAAKTLEESAETVNRNVVIARELASGLQAIELTASGLKNALRDLAAQASENRGIKCHFKCSRGVRVPDDTAALHLYRVAQEAVTNAVKHSGAKNILISLDRNSENVCVSVQDDGKGFVPRKRQKGLGLHMMRYRANALGGELKIEPRKTGGMDVTCVIPVRR
jgi:PAS domain S-box-containing protein